MKRILVLIAVAALGVLLVSCSGQKEFDFEKGKLVVGMEADYAPFNWTETTKKDYNYPIENRKNEYVAGYDVEMAKLIAAELELTLVIKALDWDALPQALNSGIIDVIIAGMSPTEERKENILFSEAYYNVNHVVVATKTGSLKDMTSLEDLSGKKGIGQKDTIYDDLVVLTAERYGATRLNPLASTPLVATAVATGTVADFMIVEKPVALGIIENTPTLKIVFETDENVFELTEGDCTLSVGMRKIDTLLSEKINEALSNISQEVREQLMDDAVERSANI